MLPNQAKVYFTFCSAKKDDLLRGSSEEVPPEVLYTSQRVRSFVSTCKRKSVRWAIFSDEYGIWFPEVKHRWYDTSPDDAVGRFRELLADFDQKLKDFDQICFCPGVGTGRIHHLYKRLIRESSLKDKISTRYFMDIV